MKTPLLSGLIAAATVTGVISTIAPAQAAISSSDAVWSQSQPTIIKGFNASPFQKFVQAESVALPNSSNFQLDPTKLKLKFDHNVSIAFINEGAGYRNQLAYESTGTTTQKGLLFKDISCEGSGCVGGWGGNALALGDSVNVGMIKSGSQLDFTLRADGLNRGSDANVFGSQTAMNADGLQHMVAYAYFDEVSKTYTGQIILGFEDLYGGLRATGGKNENSDRDFNDTVFVLDIGKDNVRELINPSQAVPEPSAVLSLAGLGAMSLFGLRRRRQARIG
jgi:Domain of unknown function (DUF4114)/PEP-CTERM motif